MQAEKEPKRVAGVCLESVQLDPEMYRLGHTKARIIFIIIVQCVSCNPLFCLSVICSNPPFYSSISPYNSVEKNVLRYDFIGPLDCVRFPQHSVFRNTRKYFMDCCSACLLYFMLSVI